MLHAACVAGDLDDVVFLITVGADLNSKGDMGYTPLHYAVEQEHEDIVALLINKGADKNIKNSDGELPIDMAKMLNKIKMLKLLQ